MSDLFESRGAKPMLIGADAEPFDSAEHIFELKLDGERALAYLDARGTELVNKRGIRLLPRFPELAAIHALARGRLILDGELTVTVGGKPDFSRVQQRSLLSNTLKIDLLSRKYPAAFVAFDILYMDGKPLHHKPLMERKAKLETAFWESERLALSRYIEEKGAALCELARERGLEGVVAKRKLSPYHMGRRTSDWVKIKNMSDEDFAVCGYIHKRSGVVSLVLGQYGRDGALKYKGHVTMGMRREDFMRIEREPPAGCPFSQTPRGNEGAVWLSPSLCCTVKYLMKTPSGGMRHPILKGLRPDKTAKECVEA